MLGDFQKGKWSKKASKTIQPKAKVLHVASVSHVSRNSKDLAIKL